jgi:transcriptional regulator with PAS, ATPase and Fis domain
MPPPPDDPAGMPARVRWQALFARADRPLFVLSRHRRVRFVNPAWERLAGRPLADVWGAACGRAGRTDPLFRTLAPPPEAVAGRVATVRRPVPAARTGPPWWDVTFVPLTVGDAVAGYLGLIDVVAPETTPARPVPAAVGAARRAAAERLGVELFAGTGPAAARLVAQLRLAAGTDAPVWLVGEPGSGKETAARTIHHAGPGRERPFVAVDCGGLQPYLVESLLFGRGGLAGGAVGTVYLKEPAALPPDLQLRLADWLLAPGGPRAVCGATATAADAVRAGRLRAEFQAGLAVLELRLPPLRDRPDDLPRVLDRLADRLDPRPVFAADLVPALRAYRWPGNVRELADVLADAAARAGDQPVAAAHLPRFLRERAMLANDPRPAKRSPPTLDEVLAAVERRMIAAALRAANGNQTEAAARLGVFRARLGRRIDALGLGGGT